MNLKWVLLFSIFMLAWNSSFLAQECDKIWLEGKIKDTTISEMTFVFQVLNLSKDTTLKTKSNGVFEGFVDKSDSLLIKAFGYKDTLFIVESNGHCSLDIEIQLDLRYQLFNTVQIYKVENLSDLREQRYDLKRERYDNSAMGGPISSLYSMLSKKEQNKRKLIEIKYEDEKRRVLKQMLFLCLKEGYIQLPQDEVQPFLHTLYISDDFFKRANNYELLVYLKNEVNKYIEQKEID